MSCRGDPLREGDIRPADLMADQRARYLNDVRRLLARKSEFVRVTCPACDGSRVRPAFRKLDLDYVECSDCDTLYINPRPPAGVLEEYYARSENYAYWNQHIFPASEEARRERIFRPRAERLADLCRRHRVPCGTLLEIGAGFGTFGEEVRRLGLFEQLIFVEPTPELAATCRRRGLAVIESPIERAVVEPASVDVIASFEVLEHLFSPATFLDKCASLLRSGGLIVLTCPNVRGFDVATLGPLSDTVDAEHLNYFHPHSLNLLFRRCGLATREISTPGQLDAELVRKRILSGEIDVSGQSFLRNVLVDEWDRLGAAFQQFLAENGLSSHMWAVAEKRRCSPSGPAD